MSEAMLEKRCSPTESRLARELRNSEAMASTRLGWLGLDGRSVTSLLAKTAAAM
jgi:hypothetical protein